ncbi:hypothetical protein DY000_02052439 [Brassica cretica]|uniref:Uncharacterized protein n=1 Tax=Brassica cretica TaxID=69181 RepID=A0ABQ7AFY0_BRACR|nr:hypothetical protein DY000_02052439 [Brassica cretica]
MSNSKKLSPKIEITAESFRDDLEECGDFGVCWSLLSAELHRHVKCIAMDEDLSTVHVYQYQKQQGGITFLLRPSTFGTLDPQREPRIIDRHHLYYVNRTTSTTSIDTTSTMSIYTCDRATIDSSTRTSIDTNPRADMVATLVLQRDENGDMHDPRGNMCNAAGQKIDGQGTAILEPSAATEDKVPLQRSLAYLTRPSQFYTNSHSDFAARHLHPPTLARVKRDKIDRQQHNVINRQQHGNIDRQQQKSSDRQPPIPYQVCLPDLDAHRLKASRNPSQTSVCLKTTEKISQQSEEAREKKQTLAETSFVESVDRRHLPGIDRRHLPGIDRRHLPGIDRRHLAGIDRHQTDGYEPAMGKQETKEEIPVEKRVKSRKPYIPKHLRREVNKEELEGFHKRVKRVPKDISFEDAYHKYRLGNFFRESRETDKDIGAPIQQSQPHYLPNTLSDTGSAVSIMAIDTDELLGLKMEPSKDSFTFVDSSRVNSAGMIKNVKVEIGECIIPVDFHAMDIKSGKTSPLLFGRAFMATVGAGSEPFTKVKGKDPRKMSLHEDRRWLRSIDRQSITSIDRSPLNCVDRLLTVSIDS